MANTISVYIVQDGDENELATFEPDDGNVFGQTHYQKAREYARLHNAKVIEYEYEYSDSSEIDDFTVSDEPDDEPPFDGADYTDFGASGPGE